MIEADKSGIPGLQPVRRRSGSSPSDRRMHVKS